jgi:hypothetical protein
VLKYLMIGKKRNVAGQPAELPFFSVLHIFRGLISQLSIMSCFYNAIIHKAEAGMTKWQITISAIALGAMCVSASLMDGLVGYWPFDEGQGTAVADKSGNGHAGENAGAAWVDGKHGKALEFHNDGDQHACVLIQSSEKLKLKTKVSCTLWLKRTKSFGSIKEPDGVFGKGGKNYTLFFSSSHVGHLGFYSNNWAGNEFLVGPKTPVNEWLHVGFTYDAGTAKGQFYFNGNAIQTNKIGKTGNLRISDDPLCIGRRSPKDNFNAESIIDDLRIYDRVLTAEEVKACMEPLSVDPTSARIIARPAELPHYKKTIWPHAGGYDLAGRLIGETGAARVIGIVSGNTPAKLFIFSSTAQPQH